MGQRVVFVRLRVGQLSHPGHDRVVVVVTHFGREEGADADTGADARTGADGGGGAVGAVAAGELAVLEPKTNVSLRAVGGLQAMLLGGARFPTPRYIWWNFVASSRERIESAKERWRRREFPAVPGDTEFIPLPDQ